MRHRHFPIWITGWTLIILLCTRSAFAMAPHSDCTAPFVFSDADVNVVVLPYRSAADPHSPLGQIGQQLALLIKLEVFSHILDYGSVGAVQMEVPFHVDNVDSCEPRLVMQQVLGQAPGAVAQITQGRGMVCVWGILYEEQDDVVVQTYVRYLRRGTSERVISKIGGFDFRVEPNMETVVFAPRLVSKDTLSAMQRAFTQADFVRTAPLDDAPGEPLPRQVQKCFGCGENIPTAFQVLEKKSHWIRVRWQDTRLKKVREGWIHSGETVSGQPLDQILPELSFTEGVVGYLHLRIADARRERLSKAQISLARQQFQSFLDHSEGELLPKAPVVAEQLLAILDLICGDPQSLTRSQAEFSAALKAAPSDLNSATGAALSRLSAEWFRNHSVTDQRQLEAEFTAAGTLAAEPASAVRNLKNFYALLKSTQSNGTPREIPVVELEARLHEIGLVREQ